ncbi:hypothetical protein [Elizabethkingia meningoseptica]|uniref:hypothetical protein n=1 Tax=Elizabethkingia meningoseptica TaxID=238 RepID=UPI00389219CB
MHADLKGALKAINSSWKAFVHNGKSLSKDQVEKILNTGISKGYKTTADFKENEVDEILGIKKKYDAYGGLGREADEPGFYDRNIF